MTIELGAHAADDEERPREARLRLGAGARSCELPRWTTTSDCTERGRLLHRPVGPRGGLPRRRRLGDGATAPARRTSSDRRVSKMPAQRDRQLPEQAVDRGGASSKHQSAARFDAVAPGRSHGRPQRSAGRLLRWQNWQRSGTRTGHGARLLADRGSHDGRAGSTYARRHECGSRRRSRRPSRKSPRARPTAFGAAGCRRALLARAEQESRRHA